MRVATTAPVLAHPRLIPRLPRVARGTEVPVERRRKAITETDPEFDDEATTMPSGRYSYHPRRASNA